MARQFRATQATCSRCGLPAHRNPVTAAVVHAGLSTAVFHNLAVRVLGPVAPPPDLATAIKESRQRPTKDDLAAKLKQGIKEVK